MNDTVWVTHSFVAWHSWPDAPLARDYLAKTHRHRFGVRCEVNVNHHDREIEFHDLLDVVRKQCGEWEWQDVGSMSCEQLARGIADAVQKKWPDRQVECSVDEDGECGSTIVLSSPAYMKQLAVEIAALVRTDLSAAT